MKKTKEEIEAERRVIRNILSRLKKDSIKIREAQVKQSNIMPQIKKLIEDFFKS